MVGDWSRRGEKTRLYRYMHLGIGIFLYSRSVRGARCTSGWLDPVKARHIIISIKYIRIGTYLICTYTLIARAPATVRYHRRRRRRSDHIIHTYIYIGKVRPYLYTPVHNNNIIRINNNMCNAHII